jgi:RNA polymerase sigma factor (sigma-70 family)
MSGAAPGRQKDRQLSASAKASRPPDSYSSAEDGQLIRRCLKGDQEAWSTLIEKYKNLIYSIPVKLGMHQDANDIFQSVCVELLSQLPNLREHRALPKWLMQTCYHKCLHQQRNAGRMVELTQESEESASIVRDSEELPEQLLMQLEQEQILRDCISQLPEKCERMVRLLFFQIPPRPYDAIAKELSMSTGSIGAIRGRCLSLLKKFLEKRGF